MFYFKIIYAYNFSLCLFCSHLWKKRAFVWVVLGGILVSRAFIGCLHPRHLDEPAVKQTNLAKCNVTESDVDAVVIQTQGPWDVNYSVVSKPVSVYIYIRIYVMTFHWHCSTYSYIVIIDGGRWMFDLRPWQHNIDIWNFAHYGRGTTQIFFHLC